MGRDRRVRRRARDARSSQRRRQAREPARDARSGDRSSRARIRCWAPIRSRARARAAARRSIRTRARARARGSAVHSNSGSDSTWGSDSTADSGSDSTADSGSGDVARRRLIVAAALETSASGSAAVRVGSEVPEVPGLGDLTGDRRVGLGGIPDGRLVVVGRRRRGRLGRRRHEGQVEGDPGVGRWGRSRRGIVGTGRLGLRLVEGRPELVVVGGRSRRLGCAFIPSARSGIGGRRMSRHVVRDGGRERTPCDGGRCEARERVARARRVDGRPRRRRCGRGRRRRQAGRRFRLDRVPCVGGFGLIRAPPQRERPGRGHRPGRRLDGTGSLTDGRFDFGDSLGGRWGRGRDERRRPRGQCGRGRRLGRVAHRRGQAIGGIRGRHCRRFGLADHGQRARGRIGRRRRRLGQREPVELLLSPGRRRAKGKVGLCGCGRDRLGLGSNRRSRRLSRGRRLRRLGRAPGHELGEQPVGAVVVVVVRSASVFVVVLLTGHQVNPRSSRPIAYR